MTGILEASTYAALNLLRNRVETDDPFRADAGDAFGVVSTADGWKDPLESYIRDGVLKYGQGDMEGAAREVFQGVETCGLSAGELHSAPQEEVKRRVMDAAGRLTGDRRGKEEHDGGRNRKVSVLVLGCAGMVGMEGWVREVGGPDVRVVDGVRAGVGALQGLVRGAF